MVLWCKNLEHSELNLFNSGKAEIKQKVQLRTGKGGLSTMTFKHPTMIKDVSKYLWYTTFLIFFNRKIQYMCVSNITIVNHYIESILTECTNNLKF